jgi:uncharacterized LabA/DUF88 family protein
MRANVYIDGFNLYYSALRRRFPDCKWLDVRTLAETLFPNDEIGRVLYFSARVIARPDDLQEATRQQMYFRALATRDVEIFLGQFRSGTRWMRRTEPCPRGTDCPVSEENIRVISTEEKGSDVNLASHLLIDAFKQDCEMAIVLTNDTDLVEPIRLARDDLGLYLALLSPSQNPARILRTNVDVLKSVRHGPLQASQFPDVLSDHRGEIHRPRAWRPVKR